MIENTIFTNPYFIAQIQGTRVRVLTGWSYGFMAPANTEATVVDEHIKLYPWYITVQTDDGRKHRISVTNTIIVQRAEGPIGG